MYYTSISHNSLLNLKPDPGSQSFTQHSSQKVPRRNGWGHNQTSNPGFMILQCHSRPCFKLLKFQQLLASNQPCLAFRKRLSSWRDYLKLQSRTESVGDAPETALNCKKSRPVIMVTIRWVIVDQKTQENECLPYTSTGRDASHFQTGCVM